MNTCVVDSSGPAVHPTGAQNMPLSLPELPPGEGLPSPERVREEISHVLSKALSPSLAHWAGRYAEVGRRNMYLWKWCRQGVEVTTLPCVAAELRDEVCDTKVQGVMLDVLLDDVADRKGDGELLEKLLSLPFGGRGGGFSEFPPQDRAYAEFTVDVWREIQARAAGFPRYAEFARLLRYDYIQLFNVMRYSHLVNDNLALLNLAEHDLYTPHNMHMMVSATLDLMCSPDFDAGEVGKVRDAVWNAQCMGRIGNLVTTWERELAEGDFTSGVYASALGSGDLTPGDLEAGDRERIRSGILAGEHEARFLRRWQQHRRYLLSQVPRIRSFDLAQLVRGLERLICLHLGSRGYK